MECASTGSGIPADDSASAPCSRAWSGILPVLASVFWVVVSASPAGAHATLLATTPPAGYAVAAAPSRLTLDFDEPVSVSGEPLRVSNTAGRRFAVGDAHVSVGGRRLSASLPHRLADGGYRVRWQVTADDGDLVTGEFTFSVGAGAAPRSARSGDGVNVPVAALRWALFTALALGLGGAAGTWLADRVRAELAGERRLPPGPPILLVAGALGLAAVALVAAESGVLSLSALVRTGAGRALGMELAGFAAAVACAVLGRFRLSRATAGLGAVSLLVVVAGEAVRAHPHEVRPVAGGLLTVVHLVAVSVWVGALVHVLRAARAWRGYAGAVRLLVYDYSRLAVGLVVVVVASGLVEAFMLVPSAGALVDTGYGRVLVVKVAVVALVAVLALLSRRHLSRSVARRGVPVGRAARAERAALVLVLAVAAVLVSVNPPGPVRTALAAPPPPVGPVVPDGTLAGQVTVTAAASAGQLVVHLSTPGDDSADPAGRGVAAVDTRPVPPPKYRLSGEVRTGPGQSRSVGFRDCGTGCFLARVSWRRGVDRVTLGVAAPPWHGGTAYLDVPWPARPAPAALDAVVRAMRAIPAVTVREAITSDYAGDPGPEAALHLSGPAFLATVPYGDGGVPGVVVLAVTGDGSELGFASPAAGVVVRMRVDAGHRIVREVMTTPNHLITHTFDYGG